MNEAEGAAPAGIDVRTPNVARMYDYLLGGKDHFAADRETADKLAAAAPEVRMLARENRAFLRRAVRFLTAEAGIRQFIDLGTGLPTQGAVHEVAHDVAPEAHVVYVDNDPVAVVHNRELLSGIGNATTIQADMLRPNEVFDHPDLRTLIDFEQPVAVLFLSVLHFVTNDRDPAAAVARYRQAVPSGSYLALTHATAGTRPDAEQAVRAYDQATSSITLRTPEEILSYFGDFELVEPGLVNMSEWRCTPSADVNYAESGIFFGGVARKP